jgi:allantoinase
LISGLTQDEVRTMIGDSVATIRRHSGQDVVGFLAPAISATETFLDLLPEFGIRYTVDMMPDDQPVPLKVRSGRLIAIPYSTEINDIRVIGVRGYTADEWAAMVKACFDQLYREGRENGMVMCVPLHPFVIGHPHRIADSMPSSITSPHAKGFGWRPRKKLPTGITSGTSALHFGAVQTGVQ